MKTKIGIDLGTSTCEISYIDGKEAKVIKNLQEGESAIIPSAILLSGENSFKVGNVAKKKAILNPELVVENIKGLLGSKKSIRLGDDIYNPEYISAIMVKRLKEIAEFNINKKIDDVIVTVPAKFDSLQRKATRDALVIAGFENVEIINEPTAAAISYGITNLDKCEKVLVYDLGGGTFDVSILEIENNNYRVLASNGDLNLGGNTINQILFDTIVNLFETSVGVKLDNSNKRLITELNKEIEEAKKSLSFENTASIVVPNITRDSENNSLDLNLDLNREDFEYLIEDFLDRTLDIVQKTLNLIEIDKNEIDKVLLVGGSTRIPLVREKVNTLFNGKILNGVNPEEIVAKGAILSTLNNNNEILAISEILNNDIGVEVFGGKFDKIIKKGTKLPVTVKKSYKTVEDNQEIAEIRVYEGQNINTEDNKFISSFDVDNIPKDEKGYQHIDLNFTCNRDGVLVAESKVISNLSEMKKKISLKGLTEKDIEVLRYKISKVSVFDKIASDEENELEKENIRKEEERRKEEYRRKLEEERKKEEEERRRKLEDERKKEEEERRRKLEEERKKEEERRRELEEERIKKEERLEQEKIKYEKKENNKQLGLKLNLSNNQIKNIVDKNEQIKEDEVQERKENKKVEEIQEATEEVVDISSVIEEYDPARDGEIYDDMANLMEYYKKVSPELDAKTKEKVQQLIGDLVGFVKNDSFREARGKENEILQLIYRG